MNNVWVKSSNAFAIQEVSQQLPTLPVGIYKLEVDPYDNLYLSHIQDRFPFPYKVYGVERPFIERVKKSWAHTDGNFGILLNGTKGTGKTVTAEILCNELNLPVILIPFHHKKLVSFLNDIQQNVIIFIDEFEKIYQSYENSLLSIMDGVLKTNHRLMFMLTTNELRVDTNLLQRPSRVRYVKTFTDLTLEVIEEVINDLLIHNHLKEATVKFISELPLITMDLIKSIIAEINIHNEAPENFQDVFNIHSSREDLFNVFQIVDGQKGLVYSFAKVGPTFIADPYSVGQDFTINNRYMGEISKVISERQVVVNSYEEDENEKEVSKIYFFEKAVKVHKAFAHSLSM